MKTLDITFAGGEPTTGRFKFPSFEPEQRKSYVAVCILLWSAIAYLLISHFVMMAVEIKGASMSPTLKDGQRYILYRCPYLWREPIPAEIVVIRDPEDHALSIKRIIGRPGDLFEIKHDGVYINGAKLPEPYLTAYAASCSGNKLIKATVLGPKDFFVLGDNRDCSADSRIYGPVPRNFILGVINKKS